MAVTPEEVAKIASLARLGLTDKEKQAAAVNLSRVLDHFSAIQAVDTAGVPEAVDSTGLHNITREDAAEPENLASHQQLLDNAPATQDGQIKVRSIF